MPIFARILALFQHCSQASISVNPGIKRLFRDFDEEQAFIDKKRGVQYDRKWIQEPTTFWRCFAKSPQESTSETPSLDSSELIPLANLDEPDDKERET